MPEYFQNLKVTLKQQLSPMQSEQQPSQNCLARPMYSIWNLSVRTFEHFWRAELRGDYPGCKIHLPSANLAASLQAAKVCELEAAVVIHQPVVLQHMACLGELVDVCSLIT